MLDIEKLLYNKIKSEISKWNESGIYAISFFIYSNEAYEFRNYKNVSTFAISYNTEADCNGADSFDEERWNYAFWRQAEVPIIDIDEPNDCTEALYEWYKEQGIDNISYEDTVKQYDDEGEYIGKGPVGHYELVCIASNVAKKLQEEGFIKNHFKKPIPIIIHGLEYTGYYIEATKKANPNGEVDSYIEAISNNGINAPKSQSNIFSKRKYPFSLFLIGFIINILFRFVWLFIPAMILLIAGSLAHWCSYIGLTLLSIDIIISFIEQMRIRHTMLSDSDNKQLRKFQKALSGDCNAFKNILDIVETDSEEYNAAEELERNDFIINMWDCICKKCKAGDELEKLNEHEKVFFITQLLEQEVNNGGFSQFFYNSSGNFANDIVNSFTKIGAVKTAEICKKALAVFGDTAPVDRNERENFLDSKDCDDILNKCDDAFYNYEEDLELLNYTYIMKHRKYFIDYSGERYENS